MSDEDRDLDIDSDDEGGLGGFSGTGLLGSGGDQDKRAHHNMLERKRRDHIKDSFSSLKDAVPTLQVPFLCVPFHISQVWKLVVINMAHVLFLCFRPSIVL